MLTKADLAKLKTMLPNRRSKKSPVVIGSVFGRFPKYLGGPTSIIIEKCPDGISKDYATVELPLAHFEAKVMENSRGPDRVKFAMKLPGPESISRSTTDPLLIVLREKGLKQRLYDAGIAQCVALPPCAIDARGRGVSKEAKEVINRQRTKFLYHKIRSGDTGIFDSIQLIYYPSS